MTSIKSFTQQFIQDKKMIGSITPSWRYLVKKIVKRINFSRDKIIVELGPGTGAFTFKIIEKLKEDSIFLVFELNETFYNHCKRRFHNEDRLHLVHGSVLEFEKILETQKISNVDYFISSLPLSLFEKSAINSIIGKVIPLMNNDGMFVQYLYSFNRYKLLKKQFNQVTMDMTLLNLPPAIIFKCKK